MHWAEVPQFGAVRNNITLAGWLIGKRSTSSELINK